MYLQYSLFSLVLFFFVLKLVKELKRSKTQNEAKRLPPGPWKLPVIGNALSLVGSLPHHALRDLARKHGALMHLQLGEIPAIVVSSPGVAKRLFKTHDLAFSNRPSLVSSQVVLYNNTNIGFAPYGDYWRQMRKICSLELLSANKVRSFQSIREKEVWDLIESIHSSSSPINLTEKVFLLTNSIVCRAAFGKRCKDQQSFRQLVKELTSFGEGFVVVDLFPSFKFLHVIFRTGSKLKKLHQRVDQILANIIHDHRTNTKIRDVASEENLLDVLLRLKESGCLEVPITSDNIKAVILDIFTAGTDTSSTTIEWAMSEMIRNPRVMEKAQAELRQALKGKKKIHETDLHGLNYIKLVVKETLRLHPPAPLLLPRECSETCEIDGYNIPVKTKVFVNAWAIGRDPEYWDDPESFEPERFDRIPSDFIENNLLSIPFGAGRRMCPGIAFGLANVELPLALLLYHFNWKPPNGLKPEDLDMSENFGIAAGRRDNLYLIATPHTPLDCSG